MINVVYRVSVVMPVESSCELFHDHSKRIYAITDSALAAGQNSYAEIEEWAEFDSLPEARACEGALLALAKLYEARGPRAPRE